MKTVRPTVQLLVSIGLFIASGVIAIGAPADYSGYTPEYITPVQAPAPNHDISEVSGEVLKSPSLFEAVPGDSVSDMKYGTFTMNDPYLDKQWAMKQIEAESLWQITTGKPQTLVAVLDTGIDQNHEDLKDKVIAEANFTGGLTADDIHGHGTHVAGVIAANADNSVGIAGLASSSRLMNVKVADDNGRCEASSVAEGIIWAANNGASVVNLSIEISEPATELEDAVNYAWNQGALIVAAAGNSGSQSPVYPGYYENCIAVAATEQDGTLAPLSNYGSWVDVAAPGFNIYSTLPGDAYGYKTGTSSATAYISGLAALLFDVVTDTNGDDKINDEVRATIEAAQEMACPR